jgi:LCP family protein required for cell wall assembly
MVSRAEEATFRVAGRRRAAQSAVATATLSGRRRFLFVLALFTFGCASMYSGTALLARIYPALFPGHTLPGITIPYLNTTISAPLISSPGENSTFNKRINLLIMGVDKRPGYRDADAYNTDTIMVATIDPITKQASALSFPRDMLIDIHPPAGGVYEDRINSSYAVGFLAGHSFDAGAKQLETDIKDNFGIDITHWIWLDFTGVEKLVDAIGGIDIDIPPDLAVGNWFYSDDDIHGVWLSFPPGKQHLDGYHAVAFGRHREYDSDFMRVKRQQLVMKTALSQVFSAGLLNNPLDLWNAYKDTIHTDLSTTQVIGYAPLLRETGGRMTTYSLGDPVNGIQTMIPFTTAGGAAVQKWNLDNVQYWLSQAFTKASWAQSNVEIQNGYGEDGAIRASALGRFLLYSRGLPTVYVGPDATPQPDTTITLYGDDKRILAEDIAKWLGMAPAAIKMQPKADPSLPDVVIVIGKDFKIPGG